MEEKSLSDEIIEISYWKGGGMFVGSGLNVKKVKEAIKRLKSYFANKDEAYVNEIIDKVFGDGLR